MAKYRDELVARGKSANTVRLDLAMLGSLYRVAGQEWGMHPLRMPVVRKPKLPAGRDRRLEAGEEEKLLAAAAQYGGEIGPMIRFALATTMRRGKIAAMRWEDVNLKKRVVHIIMAKDATEVRDRDVPLFPDAIRVLQALPRRIDGRVWTLAPDSITQAFRRVCAGAGIEGLRFHDLRHEATSRLIEQGLSPVEAAVVTGHKTMQMLKRYTHLRA
ncbi:MAG: site-specific integrase, partial [Gammaproteobacteria bacterium]